MRVNPRPVSSTGSVKAPKAAASAAEASNVVNGDRVDLSLPLPGSALVRRAL